MGWNCRRMMILSFYVVPSWHGSICYIYFDSWCITCCWGISVNVCWWCKMPYMCCIFNTTVVFVVACVIFIPGFSPCRGYWVWVFCCQFVACIPVYMLGWLCRATCYFVLVSTFQCLVYHLLSKWKEALEFTCRVIVEVLVLGLLVVVYEIPCSSCMWTR